MFSEHRFTGVAAALAVSAIMLSACSSASASASAPASTETGAPSASQSQAPAASEVTDADTCNAFSDVLTILQNATVAFNQGRTEKTEYEGWLSLATRVLATVPTRGQGAVAEDVKRLQSIAPPVSTGLGGSSPISKLDWTEGVPIGDDCASAGQEIQVQGFVGG